MDDASTDDTPKAMAGAADAQLRFFRFPENRGPAACRNLGLREARGRFVAFLDDDDVWLPAKLARQIAAVSPYEDAGPAFCFTGVLHQEGPDQYEPAQPLLTAGRPLGDFIFVDGGALTISAVLVDRDLAANFGFDETLRQHEDWLFYLRLEAAGARVVQVRAPLTVIRVDPLRNSLSHRFDVAEIRAWLTAVGPFLSDAAAAAYRAKIYAKRLLRYGHVLEGLTYLAAGRRQGLISTRRILSTLVFAVAPPLHRALTRRRSP